MTTIQVAYEVPAETIDKIHDELEHAALHDPDWNGAVFDLERADYTCIPDDDSPRAVILLGRIFDVINNH